MRLGRSGSGIGTLVLLVLVAIVVFGDGDDEGGNGGHRADRPAAKVPPPASRPRSSHRAPRRHHPPRRHPRHHPGIPALVTRVVDGDTVEVLLGGREDDVRYIGVDTPETVKPGTPVQCYGPRASDFNHRLVEGHRVWLVFDAERRDVYGRLLAYVYLGRRFVNAELVRRGLARTLTIAPNDTYAPLFARLQRVAGRRGRGLWSACSP